MTTVISKWGNSLALRIPADIIEKSNLHLGDRLDVSVSRHGRITLQVRPKEIDFSALYTQITPENRYESIGNSRELGNESTVW